MYECVAYALLLTTCFVGLRASAWSMRVYSARR